MKFISRKALIFALCCLLSLTMLSGMKRGGRAGGRGGNNAGRQNVTAPDQSQTTAKVAEPKKVVEKKPLLPHCYDVLEEQLNWSEVVYKDESTVIKKSGSNVYWVDVSGETPSYNGLTLPVSADEFNLKQVVVLKDGGRLRAVFCVNYYGAGDISFVAQDLPDVFDRQVIHIPHKICCMSQASDNTIMVAIQNTIPNDAWTYCFVHYGYSDHTGLVNLGKYFCQGTLKTYSEGGVSITLNPAANDFVGDIVLNKPMEETQEVICTHSGKFHVDELLAIAMLRMLKKYENAKIIRSRDPDVWRMATVLVDVGWECNPNQLKFDHHQDGFDESFDPKQKSANAVPRTRLSSAGLVFKKFGKMLIRDLLLHKTGTVPSDEQVAMLYRLIYKDFIEEIDARDNGEDIAYTVDPKFVKYAINTVLAKAPEPKKDVTPVANQSGGQKRGQAKKAQKPPAKVVNPADAIFNTVFPAVSQYNGTKYLPRFSGRLSLSGISTNVKKLNEAALQASRNHDNASRFGNLTAQLSAAQTSEMTEVADENISEALRAERTIYEASANSMEHFLEGVELLHAFFLEAFEEAYITASSS